MQCVRQHRNFGYGKVTDRLHIGNRWMSLGMNTYDNTARFHYPLIPSFDTPDPCLDKYPDLSPYSHCAGNPLRYVDPSGKEYGDTLGTRDDAARDFGECYNGISIIENAEYVTNIYTFSIDNGRVGYSYTTPQKGTPNEIDKDPLKPSNGEEIVARAHTHAAFSSNAKNNVFSGETGTSEGNKHVSSGDLFLYNIEEVDGYVATPNGSLKRYDYQTGDVSIISTQMPSDINDPMRLNNVQPNYSLFKKLFNLINNGEY